MDSFEEYCRLFAEAERLKPREIEKDIFSIGGRGHYENPKSDLLAFFIDPRKEHGLGSLFLRSLFDCMGESSLALALSATPQREVVTYNGNKIDLVLEGDDWVVVIENKIWHAAVNPFADYVSYAEDIYRGKIIRFVLLCVRKEEPNGWRQINWLTFAENLERNLGIPAAPPVKEVLLPAFVRNPDALPGLINNPFRPWRMDRGPDSSSKWPVLAKEFVLHIKKTCGDIEMDQKKFGFVQQYFSEIDSVLEMRDSYVAHIRDAVCSAIKDACVGFSAVDTGQGRWDAGTYIRFYLGVGGKKGKTNVTLLFNKIGSFEVIVYVYDVPIGAINVLRSAIQEGRYEYGTESGMSIQRFRHKGSLDYDSATKEIVGVSKKLEAFLVRDSY